ncbi:MraY family glycosyltransferase [Pontixanthobacter gangjinensis]
MVTEINHRSSHKLEVPSFGGVAFFLVLILIISVLQSLRTSFTGNHLIIGLTFLFMAGLKDDLVVSSAKLKFISQVFAAGFIIFSPELSMLDLHGFLGIGEIPLIIGYGLKLLIVVALINAYNLIDGIDGLAGIAGIVICSIFALAFYLVREPYFVLLSVSAVGILAAFLRYNFSNSHRKMFMGDGGSLIIGFLIAFLSLKILVMPESPELLKIGFLPENRALFVLAVLFLPIFDTLRVILIRLSDGKSPFEADRNHLHHVLLDNNLSHKKASLVLGGLNILIIAVCILVSRELNSLWMSAFCIFLFLVVGVMFEMLKKRAQELKQAEPRRPKGIRVQLRELVRENSFFSL